jgi:hypothetical protein
MTRRRSLAAAACALLIARVPPARTQRAPAPEWNLQALMTSLRQVRESTSRFVETRHLRLLNQARTSSGRLIYVAPDRLQKETTEPATARLTVAGDRLTIERQGERTREIALGEHPEIGALVESVRATLAGDLSGLTRHFTVSLQGAASAWALRLEPRDPKTREMVASIQIRGEQAAIREIETLEADGDRTDMAIVAEPQ